MVRGRKIHNSCPTLALRVSALSWALLVAAGCATYPDQTNPEMTAEDRKLFGECANADGALALKVYQDGAMVGAAEAEWLAPSTDWTLQLLSPLGQTFLVLKREGTAIDATGPFAARLPPLIVGEEDFLEVDGHFVAIKASEVPCLLRGVLPAAWGQHLRATQDDGAKRRIWFDDGDRVTKVTTVGDSKSSPRMYCAQVKWGGFIFGQKLVYCQELTGRRTTTVRGVSSYRLEWVPL